MCPLLGWLGRIIQPPHCKESAVERPATYPIPVVRIFQPGLLHVLDQLVCRVKDISMDGGDEHRVLVRHGEDHLPDDGGFSRAAQTYQVLN